MSLLLQGWTGGCASGCGPDFDLVYFPGLSFLHLHLHHCRLGFGEEDIVRFFIFAHQHEFALSCLMNVVPSCKSGQTIQTTFI